mgnify:CR=1 FL=1
MSNEGYETIMENITLTMRQASLLNEVNCRDSQKDILPLLCLSTEKYRCIKGETAIYSSQFVGRSEQPYGLSVTAQ